VVARAYRRQILSPNPLPNKAVERTGKKLALFPRRSPLAFDGHRVRRGDQHVGLPEE